MKQTADELLARIPHDVRSPLLVITATASLLRESVPADHRAAVEKILREALRIDRMLENRTIAVLLAHGHEPRREWVTVEELAAGALARVEPLLDGRRVELAVDDGAVAHVESRLVEIVIANLVDNAIRHAGGVLVLAGHGDEASATIEVVDAGLGSVSIPTPPAPLATAHPASGLRVARDIIDAHGGTLEIVSRGESGRGSVVRVCLPHAGVPPTVQPDEEHT